ncbi:MAG: TIGR01777 family oxidoreductase [Kiritimatiellae bacterium]|nr:TIGR01777 family oxidoreductase [Kiritimatiellia bacterium]
MKVLVTGSTGLIGSALVRHLTTHGHYVIRLVRRNPDRSRGDIAWDPATGRVERNGLEKLDAVIHLAGESLFGLWTEEKKRRIHRSRVQATEFLTEALAGLTSRPRVILSASAIGYYGTRADQWLSETSGPGMGFLPSSARSGKRHTDIAANGGIRVATLRTGVVLSSAGGMLKKMLPAFRAGLGGQLGHGRQYLSWIDLEDLVSVIQFIIENDSLSGPINAVAPEPVTNRDFTKALGAALNRPTFMHVPSLFLQLLPGNMGREILLASQRVDSAKLRKAGFEFLYPTLAQSLAHNLEGKGK